MDAFCSSLRYRTGMCRSGRGEKYFYDWPSGVCELEEEVRCLSNYLVMDDTGKMEHMFR